jgi:TPR repeat protein
MKLSGTKILTLLLGGIVLSINLIAQDTTSSLAYKRNKPVKRPTPFYQPDLAYRLWQQFNLIREANSGNAFAQHELGLRYLLGDGVPADTTLGGTWIKKAADQDLTSAIFNYGILLLNGWGVQWNPFQAFSYFFKAANDGMAQAEQVTGLMYTDNLIVKKDYTKAYNWIKKAADQKYEPAEESLSELIKKMPPGTLDTVSNKPDLSLSEQLDKDNSLTSNLGLVFIDFDSISDSAQEITDKMLVNDLSNPGNKETSDTLNKSVESLEEINKNTIPDLLQLADYGSPEALTILGRLYEKGIYFPRDEVTAASYYIRATRFDSPKGTRLLYDLSKKSQFLTKVQTLSKKDDPEALFVWYSLTVLRFDYRIAESDALNLLHKSAGMGYLPAINELGLNYYTGNYVDKDMLKAINLWQSAERLNNPEAKIQIAAGSIFGEIKSGNITEAIKYLKESSEKGSVLAQVALGFAYENGTGLDKNKSEAVKYYRYAAQRGNRFAFRELKRMYDELRPDDPQFRVY